MAPSVAPRLGLDQWAFDLIASYAKRGTCWRRQAGCLGLDKYNRIVGLGMNGVPRGFQHCTEFPCLGAEDPPGDTSNCWAVHAEANMILNSQDASSIEKVYVSISPCKTCALMLANLPNLKTVKTQKVYADGRGINILEMAGITVDVVAP
jgi:deoxycytidylate deaminase